MLATASDDFNDIVLPLLSHDDRQTRLELFGRGRELHLSTLGPDWRQVASGWKEEARVDFVSETIHHGGTPETVVDFALADPSMNVRKAAISAFVWIGSDEETAALLSKLDAETLDEVLRELPTTEIPVQMRPRVRTIYQGLYRHSADTLTGLRYLLKTAEMGDTSIANELRAQLSRLDPGEMEDREDYLIVPALEIIRGEDPEWVSRWVAERIVDGTLWREDWMRFVAAIPEEIKQRLLERLETEDVGYGQLSRSISLLAACSDVALVARLLDRLCVLRRKVAEAPDARHDLAWAVQRQLGTVFRALPANVAVAGLVNHFAREVDAIKLRVVAELFGTVGSGDSDLRAELRDGLRRGLRAYLKRCLVVVLQEDDFRGELKAQVARFC